MMIPLNTDLSTWAASIVVDFPQDNIPILKDMDWKKWGNFLIQESTFADNGAPGPLSYSDWEPWAMAVFYSMANY